mmetsp:Transcript_10832/g.17976  ORF Transcript_10832/g.17976 Transcript_10832/m.17976 type:complete len:93 (+) Transcript_10832:792-1070(+)
MPYASGSSPGAQRSANMLITKAFELMVPKATSNVQVFLRGLCSSSTFSVTRRSSLRPLDAVPPESSESSREERDGEDESPSSDFGGCIREWT